MDFTALPRKNKTYAGANGRKINYFDFLSSLSDPDCNAALKRIHPRINMREINKLIDETPYISDLQKAFYKTMLRERKEKILDKSLQLLKKKEGHKSVE